MESLIYGRNSDMIHIDTVRKSNAQAKTLEDLVAVFVGGTGGIGESTAKELFIRTTRPVAYIVGRSEQNGTKICRELHELNPDGKAYFIQKDISLIRNVDELCAELKERLPKINCLFLTAGFMALRGRHETSEGLEYKMAVNFYSRMRCTLNLMDLLTAASDQNELSRVITVLGAGSESDIQVDDLDLQHDFTLHACVAHCILMTDFCIEELARRYSGTSFSHSYPGTIKTAVANKLSGPVRLTAKVLSAVMAPWIFIANGSGERHFFQMTSQCYPSQKGAAGVPVPEGFSPMRGMDSRPGSGAYLLDWDGRPAGDDSILHKYREMDLRPKIWEHTMTKLQEAEQRSRHSSKRPADSEPEESGLVVPNPIGWRPAA